MHGYMEHGMMKASLRRVHGRSSFTLLDGSSRIRLKVFSSLPRLLALTNWLTRVLSRAV